MGLILDLIVIAIVVAFALISAKRGFVRTIIEVVGFVLVVLLANNVSTPLASATYDKLFEPAIIKAAEDIPEASLSGVQISDEMLPEIVTKFLNNNETLANFEAKINENISNGVTQAVTTASQNVIKPVVIQIVSLIYVLLITVVLLVAVNFLARFINKLFSFSLVGKANKILGAVLGIVKGVIIAFVFCTAVSLLVSVTQNGVWIFTTAAIEGSNIFKLLCLI